MERGGKGEMRERKRNRKRMVVEKEGRSLPC